MAQFQDIFEATILGMIQGLTEFIPISSTAHLRVIPALLGWGDPGAAFSAVIQLGSLFAVIIYFRKDLWTFGQAGLKGVLSGNIWKEQDSRIVYYLGFATIPICIVGLLFSKFITGDARSLYVVAIDLIIFAVLLFISDRFSKRTRGLDDIRLFDAIAFGLGQTLALLPGASRSGSTLMTGLFLGFSREAALRFSFLLSIPAIALSGFYELFKEWDQLAEQGIAKLVVGTLVSALFSYLSISFLLQYLRTKSTLLFVIYRIVLGILLLGLLTLGFVSKFD